MKRAYQGTLVSIVTPSFNQGEFIEENILSVKKQDYPNIEHIIIDGGSTDGTLGILKRYEGDVTWISEPDNGQSQAINKGFAMATGEIIGWLNSDDVYEPGAVQTAISALSQTPDVGIVYGYARLMDAQGREREVYRSPEYSRDKLFSSPNFIRQPTVFFRKAVLDKVGYLDESLHYVMDYDLWLRMGMVADFRLIPTVLASERFHGEAKSVAREKDFWPELLSLYKKYDEVKISRAYIALRKITPLYALWRWLRRPGLVKLRNKLFGFRG